LQIRRRDEAIMSIRMTPQRRVILEELRLLPGHPTAREVFDQVRRRLPRISLGTVYRNLDAFARHGMIRTLELGCAGRRYDDDLDEHYHLCCIRCGRIVDAPMERLNGLEEALGEAAGFEVVGHRLEFEGICPECKAAAAGEHAAGEGSGADDGGEAAQRPWPRQARGADEEGTFICPDEGITH
jgi:Fe2+ or Zn2+ uptake regulation protein